MFLVYVPRLKHCTLYGRVVMILDAHEALFSQRSIPTAAAGRNGRHRAVVAFCHGAMITTLQPRGIVT